MGSAGGDGVNKSMINRGNRNKLQKGHLKNLITKNYEKMNFYETKRFLFRP